MLQDNGKGKASSDWSKKAKLFKREVLGGEFETTIIRCESQRRRKSIILFRLREQNQGP